ncbi:immunoglobulin-like domain-containing protein [Hyalangium gracile]|uniref:immunoglobulin-like domain-containing protein n=1 Tax=Hyalangium gracile TaxID=394092 RepID=UPI001CCDF9F3|nr:immunoglobulin-like domain-containing protein [Hyalangium gracile]
MKALKSTLASTWRFLRRTSTVLPSTLLLAASACGPLPEGAESQEQLSEQTEHLDDPACATQPPTIVINGGPEQTLECGPGTYTDPGAQAFDGCGNPITVYAYNTGANSSGPGPNLKNEGVYWVSYATWNAYGQVNVTRTVNVDDRTPPTLTLKGPAFMTHTCNSMWVDPGYEASDVCYGPLTHTVQRTGEVNGWAAGTYTVTYTVTDTGGNSAPPLTRTVQVVNCPW